MAVQDRLYDVVNFFHAEDRINRYTLGLDKYPRFRFFLQWRIADLLFLFVLFISFFATNKLQPFQRQFYVNDLTILHPFAEHERVTDSQLFFYASWVPISVVGVLGLLITKPKNKIYFTYISLVGLCISILLTSSVTNILKNSIGRLRPDFLARCIPKEGTPVDVMVLAKNVCTTKNTSLLLDGFRTTPSGHSSLSFAGLGYLSLWLSGQFVVAHHSLGSWRSVVSAIPAFGAALIALSRTEDYRHHFVDVILGSVIGILISWWSYRRYFPKITDEKSYVPYLIQEDEREDEENHFYDRLERQQGQQEEV